MLRKSTKYQSNSEEILKGASATTSQKTSPKPKNNLGLHFVIEADKMQTFVCLNCINSVNGTKFLPEVHYGHHGNCTSVSLTCCCALNKTGIQKHRVERKPLTVTQNHKWQKGLIVTHVNVYVYNVLWVIHVKNVPSLEVMKKNSELTVNVTASFCVHMLNSEENWNSTIN